MQNIIVELNEIVEEYGYEIDTIFGDSTLSVRYLHGFQRRLLTLDYDAKEEAFSINTVGTRLGASEIEEYSRQVSETLNLVNLLNEYIRIDTLKIEKKITMEDMLTDLRSDYLSKEENKYEAMDLEQAFHKVELSLEVLNKEQKELTE